MIDALNAKLLNNVPVDKLISLEEGSEGLNSDLVVHYARVQATFLYFRPDVISKVLFNIVNIMN